MTDSPAAGYLELLNYEMGTPGPALRPRLAASLIIVDRSAESVRVLMGRRHPGLAFMPGKYVFPGGRVEPVDRLMHAARELPETVAAGVAARRSRPPATLARALALAAVRETFEETGYAIGARASADIAAPAGAWSRFVATGVRPDLGGLQFVARAITPPGRPRRFDTTFFSVDAEAVAARVTASVGPDCELVELVWAPIEAIDDLDLAAITKVVLREVHDRLRKGPVGETRAPFYRHLRGGWRRDEI